MCYGEIWNIAYLMLFAVSEASENRGEVYWNKWEMVGWMIIETDSRLLI